MSLGIFFAMIMALLILFYLSDFVDFQFLCVLWILIFISVFFYHNIGFM